MAKPSRGLATIGIIVIKLEKVKNMKFTFPRM